MSTDFITNILEDILEEYISIKPSNKNKSSIRENYLEKSKKKPKVFTEKQHKKYYIIQSYLTKSSLRLLLIKNC